MKKRNVEILAPAGSYESMAAAVCAGADAVYIGGSRFGARAYANNLDEERMLGAIRFAHLHGCKLYMTVNTLFKEKELPELYDYLKPYYEAGLDAVIVQDLGVFQYIRKQFPKLPIHVSTQMTVTGKYSARSLKAMGAERVVPARELSLSEIREIYDETGMEIETFVHGALCYCYSGQCLFSSLIGGRSGNRGRCAQTCRLPFDAERGKESLNRKNEKYLLSLKDLCTLDILPDILEAGVCSLKIEGRMKSPRYTAGVVHIYRKYVDLYLEKGRSGYRVEKADKEMLLALFDRGGQTEGYYRQHNGRDMVVLKEKPEYREVDQKLFDYLDKTYVEGEKKEPLTGTAYFSVGKPGRLYASYELPKASGEKKAASEALLSWTECSEVEEAKNAPMDGDRIKKQLLKTGDSPFVFEKLEVTVEGNVFVPVQTLNKMRRDALEGMEEAILSRYRREPVEPISMEKEEGKPEKGPMENPGGNPDRNPGRNPEGNRSEGPEERKGENPEVRLEETPEFSVLVNTREQLETAFSRMRGWRKAGDGRRYSLYLASEEFGPELWKEWADRCHEAGILCYLMLPRIFRTEAEQYFLKNMESLKEAGFDALGIGSMEEPEFLREMLPGVKLHFDHGMYAWNHRAAMAMREYGARRLTVPVELNHREILEAGLSGELLVYGYLPMMVSAQCVQKTTRGCTGRTELLYLRDRKGKEFPTVNQCRFCYNTIYNSSPLSLLGLSDKVDAIGPEALRLNFTIEDRKTAENVLDAFYREFVEKLPAESPVQDFTRGHFRRGVE